MNSARNGHRFVFIGGLHRSGTTAVCRLIGAHPEASRLSGTGQIEDEGQFLQSVYPIDDTLGGAERFALHPGAHMTEDSPLVAGAGDQLFEAWAPYWDLTKPLLCEKTPANMVRSRFLQAAFPDSSFIFMSRHPVACALAMRKWEYELYRAPLALLIRNWIACHRYMSEDLPHLKHAMVMRYEELTADSASGAQAIEQFLGLGPGLDASLLHTGLNTRYFESWSTRVFRKGPQRWRNILKRIWCEAEVRYIEARYEREINEFGYSFADVVSADALGSPDEQVGTAPA
jgi:hypothetical protein